MNFPLKELLLKWRHFLLSIVSLFLLQWLYFDYVERNIFSLDTVPVYLFLFFLFIVSSNKQLAIKTIKVRHENLICLFSLALGVGYFFWAYAQAGGFNADLPGWRGWWDQSCYYRMLFSIINNTFSGVDYHYGLGYPLLGALVYKIYPKDPYLIVNLICYILTIVCGYKIFRLLFKNFSIAYAATLLMVLNPYLIEYIKIPWTSTVTLASYTYSLFVIFKQHRSTTDYLFFGIASGLVFITRYVDIVLLIPSGILLIVDVLRRLRLKGLLKVLPGVMIALVIFGGVLYSHKVYLGGYLKNPYQKHNHQKDEYTDGDFAYYRNRFNYQMLQHLTAQFIEAKSLVDDYGSKRGYFESVFQKNILYLFFPAGLFLMYSDFKEKRRELISALIGISLFLFIYSLHPATCPRNLMYHSAHYFKSLIVVFTACGAYFFNKSLGATEKTLRYWIMAVINIAFYMVLIGIAAVLKN